MAASPTRKRRRLGARQRLMIAVLALVSVAAGTVWILTPPAPLKVGVVFSLSGTLAIGEAPVSATVVAAFDHLNRRGGVLGRPVRTIVVDAASDPEVARAEAERLIDEGEVDVIFGCWSSACRRTVRPSIEDRDHLMVYPLQFEGLEASPNLLYTGAVVNQQITPAVQWALRQGWRRFMLVGSDYVYPRAAHAAVRDLVGKWRGEIVGEYLVPLGRRDFGPFIEAIERTRPDVILNTVNGDANIALFRSLRAAGLSADDLPVISFSVSEIELQSVPAEGHYASWPYFQSLDGAANAEMLQVLSKAGLRQVGDPMAAAWTGALLWAGAVERAGTASPPAVREALAGASLLAPEGMVHVDTQAPFLWHTVRIGRADREGGFEVVYETEVPAPPNPYPATRSRAAWTAFLDELYAGWSGWAAPSDGPTRWVVDPQRSTESPLIRRD